MRKGNEQRLVCRDCGSSITTFVKFSYLLEQVKEVCDEYSNWGFLFSYN
jgi:ubiquitin C-terminal hydrolase